MSWWFCRRPTHSTSSGYSGVLVSHRMNTWTGPPHSSHPTHTVPWWTLLKEREQVHKIPVSRTKCAEAKISCFITAFRQLGSDKDPLFLWSQWAREWDCYSTLMSVAEMGTEPVPLPGDVKKGLAVLVLPQSSFYRDVKQQKRHQKTVLHN